MKLVVFGAAGRTGRHVVRYALERGHEVVAFVRRPEQLRAEEHLTVVVGDARDAEAVARAIGGADAVISTLGSDDRKERSLRQEVARNVVAAMQRSGARRLVWISSLGVGDSAAQARRTSFFYGFLMMPLLMRHTYADSKAAEDIIRQSDLDWTIVRPPGLIDAPHTGKYRAILDGSALARAYMPRADVADYMLGLAERGELLHRVPTLAPVG